MYNCDNVRPQDAENMSVLFLLFPNMIEDIVRLKIEVFLYDIYIYTYYIIMIVYVYTYIYMTTDLST